MGLPLESAIFTTELTNDTLTITPSMGVKKLSLYNGTSVSGTVLGTSTLGGTVSSAITVAEGETFTVSAPDQDVIKNLTITAAAGCTFKIVAQ